DIPGSTRPPVADHPPATPARCPHRWKRNSRIHGSRRAADIPKPPSGRCPPTTGFGRFGTVRSQPHVLGIVLAGGEGKRLFPLTADRAKPAVPFGGAYRRIDFVLSNLVNAGFLRLCGLTQYKSLSLDRHISQTWRLAGFAGEYITPVPAQPRLGPRWYTGSADAIMQSL